MTEYVFLVYSVIRWFDTLIMKNLDVIKELYYSYISKRQKAYDLVVSNEVEIRRLEEFFNSVNLQDVDLKFFSPYSSSDIYEGEIEDNRLRLESLYKENEIQNQLIEELDLRISQFKEIISESEDNNHITSVSETGNEESKTDTGIEDEKLNSFENHGQEVASDFSDNVIQNLVHLIHSIELSSMFIDSDPVRAKLELQTCSKNIQDVIDLIRDTSFVVPEIKEKFDGN